ncbi:SCO family protein [Geodermatophilus sp. FMUSA9-8]|uniref:SCO family protein n=1 Tax=Geodermatophilus sp. FMUSA9-8 TaxID=3120155 RepID=UPI00300B0FC3
MLSRNMFGRRLSALAVLVIATSLAGCAGADGSGHEGHATGSSGSAAAEVSPSADGGPFAGRELPEPRPRPEFALTSQDGAAFDFAAETGGQPTLLFFGYANCPDVCPTTMADVAIALRSVPEDVAARTRVVFVTTDPARDTPEFLGEYLARFDGDLPTRFVGLTGSQADVEAAQAAAEVPLAEGEGTMHATSLLLYGADDTARVMFSAGDTAQEIAEDLQVVARS